MKTIVVVGFSLFACIAAFGDQTETNSSLGPRPGNSVFDPTDVLDPIEQKKISEPLRRILNEEGIDVIVVILPKIGEAPPEHVANGFAEEWIKSKLNAVVLHVPDHPDSPWIVPGNMIGQAVRSEAITETIEAAEKRARAEPDDFGKVRAASIEAADAVRYWTGGALIRSEKLISQRLQRQLDFEKRERFLKMAAALGAASTIPLILGIFFLYLRIKNSRPKQFPPLRKQRRLGAPYAGGNHAITVNSKNQNPI